MNEWIKLWMNKLSFQLWYNNLSTYFLTLQNEVLICIWLLIPALLLINWFVNLTKSKNNSIWFYHSLNAELREKVAVEVAEGVMRLLLEKVTCIKCRARLKEYKRKRVRVLCNKLVFSFSKISLVYNKFTNFYTVLNNLSCTD